MFINFFLLESLLLMLMIRLLESLLLMLMIRLLKSLLLMLMIRLFSLKDVKGLIWVVMMEIVFSIPY